MQSTLFDLHPSLEGCYWYADEAATLILFGTEFPGTEGALLFAFADELTRAADRGEIEYRAYAMDDAVEITRRGQPRPPPRLLARSAIEWALQRPEHISVSPETAFWYSTLRQTPPTKPQKMRAKERYIAAILAEIDLRDYDRHAIPNGEKAELQRCLVKSGGMTAANFTAAWKTASKSRQLAIQNRDDYAKGGSKK